MHIAAAVRTPVVALFGSTNHIRSGPYGEKRTLCRVGWSWGAIRVIRAGILAGAVRVAAL